MNLLLDTHTFLWWIADDKRLSDIAKNYIENQENEIYFSAASAWEILIKTQLSKLQLPGAPESFVSEQLSRNNFKTLSIRVSHALQLSSMPALHRDPFDRILVAQSMVEHLPILTADSLIAQYQIETIW
jgi:PIN domain nuclease of toxin-antitoxin system